MSATAALQLTEGPEVVSSSRRVSAYFQTVEEHRDSLLRFFHASLRAAGRQTSVLTQRTFNFGTETIDGRRRELHLCTDCARQAGVILAGPPPLLKLDAVLQSLIVAHVGELVGALAELGCPLCGLKFMEFRCQGRLGCPHFMLLAALAPKREKFYFYGTRRNRKAVADARLDLVHQEKFSFFPYELFLQPRPAIMRRIFSTSDPAALDRYRKLDDGLAKALPFWASYWVWVAKPAASAPSGVKST